MNPLLNLIWLLCGGIFTAIEYLISSLLMMITIIGIPFGFQTLKLAGLALWPFGKEVRSTPDSGGCLSIIMNIIWLFLGGIWISLSHLGWGILLCITIIGIPFLFGSFVISKKTESITLDALFSFPILLFGSLSPNHSVYCP